MRIEVEHDFEALPQDVLEWVGDLSKFPEWTKVLYRVTGEPAQPQSPRAWLVELRGKIGPFARSKRLRMIEVPTGVDGHVRFERRETDGSNHGVWILDVYVEPGEQPISSHLRAVFEYDGRLWSAAVERLLRDEIEESKKRLTRLVVGEDQL